MEEHHLLGLRTGHLRGAQQVELRSHWRPGDHQQLGLHMDHLLGVRQVELRSHWQRGEPHNRLLQGRRRKDRSTQGELPLAHHMDHLDCSVPVERQDNLAEQVLGVVGLLELTPST